jgi:ribonuclease E
VITEYLESVAPDLLDRVDIYDGKEDLFDRYRVGEQIGKALERKVYLPSGGSLVIDRTEAMTVVDVNTGKFVGSGGNLEQTVTKNNLEAAEEIVRQLRLRDIGGIIVVDFIDMVLESNRDLVSRRLIECLGRDRTKHQVAEVTSLGLVQMTRKKLGLGLLESFSEPCEVCSARGAIVHVEPIMRTRSSNEGKSDKKRKGHMEVANVVTPERASEINSVVAKIAASTMGTGKIESKPMAEPAPAEPSLEGILEALPEAKPDPKVEAKRKPRRATSPAKVDPGA